MRTQVAIVGAGPAGPLLGALLHRAGVGHGLPTLYEATQLSVHDFEGTRPQVRFHHAGAEHVLDCDFIAGCDGFHGVCRASVPASAIRLFERIYPFGWLGLLSQTPP